MKRLSSVLLVMVALCAQPLVANAQQKSIVETAVAAGNFNTLVAAVKAADLVDALSGSQPLTVFAPTDAAFEKIDPLTMDSLLDPANRDQLKAILTYHVVAGRVKAADAYGLNSSKSLQGQRLNLNLRGETPTINNSKLVVTDIECSNGVIHVIDEVLLPASKNIPETAVEAGVFNTLVAAVGAADLAGALSSPGPFTVFAPTDEAFAKLPEGTVETLLKPENRQQLVDILKYHVVSGRIYDDEAVKAHSASTLLGRSLQISFSAKGLMVNDANVTAKNVEASNGVIHVIDSVLLPSPNLSAREALAMLESAVNAGVPTYNSGNYKGCCDIYTAVMKDIKEAGISGMQNYVSAVAVSTMSNAEQSVTDSDRAWALRRGIDSLRSRLGKEVMNR